MFEAAVHAAGDPGLEPHHGFADGLQHAAVMADEHDAGAGGGEFLLQPLDRRQVEVVGRFVQQEQVGGGGEGAGQGGAPGLAAGEMRRVLVAGQAEAVEQRRAAVLVVAGAHAVLHVVERGGETAEVGFLREIADGGAGLDEAGAAVGTHQAGGDFEQGGFAGAVAADQADALAGADADRGAVQQGLGAQGGADVLQQEEGGSHGRLSGPATAGVQGARVTVRV